MKSAVGTDPYNFRFLFMRRRQAETFLRNFVDYPDLVVQRDEYEMQDTFAVRRSECKI